MSRKTDKWVEISFDSMKLETDKAYLFTSGEDEHWIPKSQMNGMDDQHGQLIVVTMTEWIAKDKGLI